MGKFTPDSVKVTSLRPEIAFQSFQKAIECLDTSTIGQVKSIAIKINICEYRDATTGAVTDPQLLGVLLDVLHTTYPQAQLFIVENDATSIDMQSAFRLLGFEKVAKQHHAHLHNVSDGEWIQKKIPDGMVFQEIEVPAILETCDLFINFAKLKTNALTKTTGCLKNIFAFLRMKRKVVLHGRINQVLVDMNKVIKPDLCLVDGYIGMEGMGAPAYGRPKRSELLIAGVNPVAVDACSAKIMGFRPKSVEHIRLCHQAGLGPIDYKLDTDIPNFAYRNYKFEFEHWEYWLRNLIRSRAGFAT
jgi:uncharacterized protein (DUF362 family)